MSDDELDRDWVPNPRRPQSTMARSFSAALNDLFKIDNSLADLDAAVSEKKRQVSSQASELEALEARIRATEARLAQTKALNSSLASSGNAPAGARHPRTPLDKDTFTQPAQPSQSQQEIKAALSRGYAMPPVPAADDSKRSGPSNARPTTGSGARPGTGSGARPGTSKSNKSGGMRRQDVPQRPPTPNTSEGATS